MLFLAAVVLSRLQSFCIVLAVGIVRRRGPDQRGLMRCDGLWGVGLVLPGRNGFGAAVEASTHRSTIGTGFLGA